MGIGDFFTFEIGRRGRLVDAHDIPVITIATNDALQGCIVVEGHIKGDLKVEQFAKK